MNPRATSPSCFAQIHGICVLVALCLLLCPPPCRATMDVAPLQARLDQGQAEEVWKEMDQALKQDPENAHLLYNRAIASYAAGRFEEALLDFDVVEKEGGKSLSRMALFQKGNAEFRLGWDARNQDLEATISRWKQSLAHYDSVLKSDPNHKKASENRAQVRQLLVKTLMTNAVQHLESGQQQERPPEQRILSLRNAMDQFHEVNQMEPGNSQAEQGEKKARDLLADALAAEGTKKTLANNMVQPGPNEPLMMRPDVGQVREGVNMLEDAQALKPNDPNIAEQLDQGRERLANALTLQAQLYQNLELRIQRVDDKLGILRMAMELAEKALEQKPNHQRAQQTLEQIKSRLAQIHEQQGDQLSQQAENSPLEQQAKQLSQSLDHFQQADGLKPNQQRLQQKAQQTQSRLEEALEKLGDQLMQEPGGEESLEQQTMRLQGAEQVLNELQSLKPSQQTADKARQASEQLSKVRQQLADRGQPEMPQPGSQGPPFFPPQSQGGLSSMPMDSPPKLDTPGMRGPYQSPAMNRGLRDY